MHGNGNSYLEEKMFDWHETRNGNYVCEDDNSATITVFIDKKGKWRGIRDEHITENSYPDAEAAKDAIDAGCVNFVKLKSRSENTDWMQAKKGGYYRRRHGQIVMVKQSLKGDWYITVNGSIIRDKWFKSFDDAARCADSSVS